MRVSPLIKCALMLSLFPAECGSQFAFGSVSLAAIQRIVPHATNANVFALAKGLNQNRGKFANMRTIVRKFFNENKAGNAKPKTLSLYDNSTYSRQKLISLVNNRQAVKQWWAILTPGFKKIFNAATATQYKNLYAYFDSRYLNNFDYTIVYWMLTVLMKNAWDETVYNKTADLISDSLDAQVAKTPALVFQIYTQAFEANHNQTYQKGKW